MIYFSSISEVINIHVLQQKSWIKSIGTTHLISMDSKIYIGHWNWYRDLKNRKSLLLDIHKGVQQLWFVYPSILRCRVLFENWYFWPQCTLYTMPNDICLTIWLLLSIIVIIWGKLVLITSSVSLYTKGGWVSYSPVNSSRLTSTYSYYSLDTLLITK